VLSHMVQGVAFYAAVSLVPFLLIRGVLFGIAAAFSLSFLSLYALAGFVSHRVYFWTSENILQLILGMIAGWIVAAVIGRIKRG
jgi:hypothetical protein